MNYYVGFVWSVLSVLSGMIIGSSKNTDEVTTAIIISLAALLLVAPIFGRVLGWW